MKSFHSYLTECSNVERIDEFFDQKKFDALTRKYELSKDEESFLAKHSNLPVNMTFGSGWKGQVSVHAQARAVQRRHDIDAALWKEIGRKMVKHVEANKIKSGKWMFHSKGMNQSVVAAVKGRTISFITVMPQGTNGRISKKQLDDGQQLAMMESMLIEALMLEPHYEWALDECFAETGEELDGIQVIE